MRSLQLTRCVKLLSLISLVGLLLANMHLLGGRSQGDGGSSSSKNEKRKVAKLTLTDSFSDRLRSEFSPSPNPSNQAAADDILAGDRVHGLPNSSNSRDETKADEETLINIPEILSSIYAENSNQMVNNGDLFGPVTNSTVILAVQVHNRLTYLRQLIASLSLVPGIDTTLIIFSMDVWDEQINSLIRSIDFTQTMLVFYPFSLQTHPNAFPGESPQDCPRDAKKKLSSPLKCLNAAWPDLYGHYREAKFTQTKHHWWWKANHIFHKLDVTRNFSGTVVFLEEDHYVAEDFLHTLAMMQHEQRTNYQKVDILCLGTYLRKFNYKSNAKQPVGFKPQLNGLLHLQGLPPFARSLKSLRNEKYEHQISSPTRNLLWAPSFLNSLLSMFHKAEVGQWVSAKHNMGMALSRNVWDKIRSCSSRFCQYDDYNWDWSLQDVSLNCLQEKLQVMMMKGPRECGVHHKKADCDSNLVMEKVKNILKTSKPYLYPDRLSVGNIVLKKKQKVKKGNGGWGDKRDHALCMNMTSEG